AEQAAGAGRPGGAQLPVRIANLRDKLEALAALGVERVFVARFNQSMAGMTPEAFMNEVLADGLQARRLLIGDDFRSGARRPGDLARLRRHGPDLGIAVQAVPTGISGGGRVSSSLVREALAAAGFARAAQLLGRPYRLSGRVVAGRRLG